MLRQLVSTIVTPLISSSIYVKKGESLQAAIDRAWPGDTIYVEPAVYSGGIVLPKQKYTWMNPRFISAAILLLLFAYFDPIWLFAMPVFGIALMPNYVTIRPNVADASLPGDNERITPAYTNLLIKLANPVSNLPLVRTNQSASYWRLIGIEIGSTGFDRAQMRFHDETGNTLATVPHHMIIDRCYLHGENVQWRGIEIHVAYGQIINCDIRGIMQSGRDAQAIWTAFGPGPLLIENCYLSGSTETFMSGGGDPAIAGLVPSDITIRGNYITKDVAWKTVSGTVKNTLELKNAQRVLIENNVIEHSWVDGQNGYILMLTVRNQDEGAPQSTVKDVEIRYNVLRHGVGAVNVLGIDNQGVGASVRADNINIHHNLFYDIASSGMIVTLAPTNLKFEHNTVIGMKDSSDWFNWFLYFTGTPGSPNADGLLFRRNVVTEGEYGTHGDNQTPGTTAFTNFASVAGGAVHTENLIVRGGFRTITYPAGNVLVNLPPPLDAQYRLLNSSAVSTTDGLPVGADIDAILSRIPGVSLTA